VWIVKGGVERWVRGGGGGGGVSNNVIDLIERVDMTTSFMISELMFRFPLLYSVHIRQFIFQVAYCINHYPNMIIIILHSFIL